MARRRRPDLFPRDRPLQARMLLATVVAGVLVASVLAGIVLALFGSWTAQVIGWMCIAFAVFGWVMGFFYLPLRFGDTPVDDHGWHLAVTPEQQERLDATVARLCALADMSTPSAVAYPGFFAQSFTVARLGRRPTLYVSVGLLRMLDDRELDAVVSHELSHLANRDAVLMTLLVGPPSLLFGRTWDIWATRRNTPGNGSVAIGIAVLFLPAAAVLAPFAMAMTASTRLLSRQRELYADHCAGLLTGSPAGVASALAKLSGAGTSLNLPDLRTVGDHPELRIIPERPLPTGVGRIWATHPPVDERMQQLADMERSLQHARLRSEISAP